MCQPEVRTWWGSEMAWTKYKGLPWNNVMSSWHVFFKIVTRDTQVSDRCLTEVDLSPFVIWDIYDIVLPTVLSFMLCFARHVQHYTITDDEHQSYVVCSILPADKRDQWLLYVCCITFFMLSQMAKGLGSTSIKHRSDTKVLDRCLIEVDLSPFTISDI